MNYVIDFCAKDGHLFVKYANARETGPSVSVWMLPVQPWNAKKAPAPGWSERGLSFELGGGNLRTKVEPVSSLG
jgi:hypothetical protein